jgi:C-terminal processing protease CtpA/Prc
MNIKAGDKIIAIIDAYPVNVKPTDIPLLKISKGTTVTLQILGKKYANTHLISVELERSKAVFNPLYYLSMFQKVEECNDCQFITQ